MSMGVLTIIQTSVIFCAYTLVVLVLPAVVLGNKVSFRRLGERLVFYYLLGNFYVMNLVFVLQLLHISNTFTLIACTLIPAAAVWQKINHFPFKNSLLQFWDKFRRFSGGQLGKRNALLHFRHWLGGCLKSFLGRNFKLFYKHFFEWIFIALLAAAVVYIYGTHLYYSFGYTASDIPVHNYWINGLAENNIFVAGVYPFGFHCIIYYLHEVFGLEIYVMLRVFGVIQTFYIFLMLAAFIRLSCKTKYLGYAVTIAYVMFDGFSTATYARYSTPLPQEYGMIFIFPGMYFLFRFFEDKKREIKAEKEADPNRKTKKEKKAKKEKGIRKRKGQEDEILEEMIPEEVISEEAVSEESVSEDEIQEDVFSEEVILEEVVSEEVIPEEVLSEEGGKKKSSFRKRFSFRKKYDKSGKKRKAGKSGASRGSRFCLFCFGMSFAMTLAVHFYDTMIAGLFCVGVAAGYVWWIVRKKYFLNILAAGLLSVTVAVLPMVIAFATGTRLQGSLGWGMNIIKGVDQEETSEATETEEPGGDTQQTEPGETEFPEIPGSDIHGPVSVETEPGTAGETQSPEGSETLGGTESPGTETGEEDISPGEPSGTESEEDMVPSLQPQSRTERLKEIGMTCYGHVVSLMSRDMLAQGYAWMVDWILLAIAALFVMGVFYWIIFQGFYGSQMISTAVYMLCMTVLLISGRIGLPPLMNVARCVIYYAYSLPIVVAFLADGVFYLVRLIVRWKRSMQILSLAASAALLAGIVHFGVYKVPADPTPLETNGAIISLTNIIKEEKDNTWTIVSANDERNMLIGHGYHYELITFLREMEYYHPGSRVTIPSQKVFFFIEKIPVNYAGTYEGSGRPVSTTGANYPLYFGGGNKGYWQEYRYHTMSRMYYWALEFQKLYPNEMQVYLETEDFICYKLEQNPYQLFNLAINYGFNSKVY